MGWKLTGHADTLIELSLQTSAYFAISRKDYVKLYR